MTKELTIKRRLQDAKLNKEIKDSIYRLRRFLAGDESAIGGSKMSIAYSGLAKTQKQNPIFPDYRIASTKSGVSNHTLTWVNTLVKQTLIQVPEVTFP